MKIIKIIACLCILGVISAFSCENNERDTNPCSKSNSTKASFTNASGIIGFDKTHNKYFIQKSVEGTYDSVFVLFPCDGISDGFKKVGTNVIFSGNLFECDLSFPIVGGLEVYYINLISITLANNN